MLLLAQLTETVPPPYPGCVCLVGPMDKLDEIDGRANANLAALYSKGCVQHTARHRVGLVVISAVLNTSAKLG